MGGSQSNEYQPKYNPKEYTKKLPGQNTYRINKNSVYWRGEKVNGAQGLVFIDIGYGYGKDDKNVFYNSHKIEIGDLQSFESFYNGYAKDYLDVYYKGRILSGADTKSFKMTKCSNPVDAYYNYSYGKKVRKKSR
jgi:hypothetical protein